MDLFTFHKIQYKIDFYIYYKLKNINTYSKILN